MSYLPFLRYYILSLLFIKISYIILTFRIVHLKIVEKRNPSTELSIDIVNTENIKEFSDYTFLSGTYLLMIYIFNPWKQRENILKDSHVKLILFSTGVISLIHMFQELLYKPEKR